MTKKTVAFFPGQGSQVVGMGKSLFENFSIAREVFEEASDSIGINLKRLCFEGPSEALQLTENTQPCLLTVSIAAFRSFQKETGFKPSLVAGHSLGEYSALVAAESIPLSQAVIWVRYRANAMQTAVPIDTGSMMALLGPTANEIESVCAEVRALGIDPLLKQDCLVEIANDNAPGQIVVAGTLAGLAALKKILESKKELRCKAIPLNVSAPFHCSLMAPAREKMAELFSKLPVNQRPRTLAVPYIPNRSARITQESGVILEFLTQQIDQPVLWRQSLETMLDCDFNTGIEFGPGAVLQGLAKRTSKSMGREFVVSSCADLESHMSNEKVFTV